MFSDKTKYLILILFSKQTKFWKINKIKNAWKRVFRRRSCSLSVTTYYPENLSFRYVRKMTNWIKSREDRTSNGEFKLFSHFLAVGQPTFQKAKIFGKRFRIRILKCWLSRLMTKNGNFCIWSPTTCPLWQLTNYMKIIFRKQLVESEKFVFATKTVFLARFFFSFREDLLAGLFTKKNRNKLYKTFVLSS